MKLDPKKKVATEFASADSEGAGDGSSKPVMELVRLGLLDRVESSLGMKLTLKVEAAKKSTRRNLICEYAYVAEAIDVGAELTRIRKEIDRLTKDIAGKEGQLGNETFRSRAPEPIIHGLEATLAERRVELRKLQERVKELGG